MQEKVKIGVIGAGWWAVENHIPALIENNNAEIVAVCRLGDEELQSVKSRFSIPYATTDYKQMLNDIEMDGVIVSSPHFMHYEHAKAALEKGLDVLVEKPFTTNSNHAKELIAISEKQGKSIMVPCGWNFSSMATDARVMLKEVGIGEVKHVVVQMASALEDLFSGQPMIETTNSMFRPPSSTWAEPKNAGGYGWGQLSHALSLLFSLFDLKTRNVLAISGKSTTGVDSYDAAIVQFSNNATGVLSGAATVPKHCGFQMDIRVFGTEGMFLFDVERERVEIRRSDKNDRSIQLKAGDGAYNGVRPVHHFIDYCAGINNNNPSSGLVALRSIETLSMLYEQLEK